MVGGSVALKLEEVVAAVPELGAALGHMGAHGSGPHGGHVRWHGPHVGMPRVSVWADGWHGRFLGVASVFTRTRLVITVPTPKSVWLNDFWFTVSSLTRQVCDDTCCNSLRIDPACYGYQISHINA